MKKVILSIVLTVFLLNVSAQENKEGSKTDRKIIVPELVKKAFSTKYAAATKVTWGMESKGEYEAEFVMNKTEMSAVYDEQGVLLEAETEIEASALPQAVKTTLSNDFAGYKIDEVLKAEAKGVTTYELTASKNKEEFQLVFDTNGKLLKKEAVTEEEDED